MKFVLLTTIGLSCCVSALAAKVPGGLAGKDLYARSRKPLVNTKVRLPLVFEPNVGQAPRSSQFVSRTPNGTLLLSGTEATLLVQGEDQKSKTVTMRLNGSRSGKSEALDPLPSYSSYFIGRNREDWHPRVPHFAKVRFAEVYPGIDVVYYGNDRRLEYDFVVAPGRDHSAIELAFDGADDIRVDTSGDLLIETAGKTIRQFKPRVYQWIGGVQHEIKGGYRINPAGRVQFALARYDRARPLVIDPVLQYSTYFGGSGFDLGVETAMDASGSLYVAGQTTSGSFRPSLRDQSQRAGETDAMIAKFNTPGDSLAWVAYFGGARNEIAMAIAADSAGNPVIAGWTESQDLPTRNAYQSENRGGLDTFLAKLNPTGTELTFATYLGGAGTDFGTGLALDAGGSPYVAGWTTSANFPTQRSFHSGPGGGGGDAFVTKFSPGGNSIVYSTYVSASGDEGGTGIAVDAAGAAYVTGSTTSANFPAVRAVQPSNRGGRDVYVFKIVPGGGDLEYSTLIGGTKDDVGYRIAVDASGSALVSGYTQSTDFPVSGGFQAAYGGGVTDAFVLKLSPAGSAISYASYLGGTGEESGFGNIAIDAAGSAYLTGFTSSRDFPSRNGFQQAYGGGSHDAFLVRVAPAGNTLLYSSLLGGSQTDNAYGLAVDRTGNVVVSGWTSSPDFPSASSSTLTTGGASVADIFIAHISADTSVNLIGATPQALTFSGRTGQTDPAAQTVALSSTGAPVTFTSGSSVPWLRVSANQTTTPATLTVTPLVSGLAAGTHTGEVTVNAPGAVNAPLTIRVTLTLAAVPVITTVTPSPLPRGQDAQITISGTGFVNSSEVFAGTSPLQEQFVNATTLRATVPAALLTGAAPLQLTVRNAEGASSAFAVKVGAQAPAIVSTGVVNAATGLAGFVSPGQLITIVGTDFGPDRVTSNTPGDSGQLGTTLADTRVLIDGAAVPIVSVARNQINAIVPSSVADKNNVRVEVEFQGQRSAPVGVGVGPASPGLFTANSSGTGQAAAQNQDSSTNQASNPAERGSVVVLYATGFGLTTPASVDGTIVPASPSLPVPVLPVRVTIGGTPAEVVYAGTAPGLLSGLMQINARIAPDVTPGEAVPVVLSIGSATSRTGVTIAVK